MSKQQKAAKRPRPTGTLPSRDLEVEELCEVQVDYLPQPAAVPKEQEIHPRRAIPALPAEPPPTEPERRKG